MLTNQIDAWQPLLDSFFFKLYSPWSWTGRYSIGATHPYIYNHKVQNFYMPGILQITLKRLAVINNNVKCQLYYCYFAATCKTLHDYKHHLYVEKPNFLHVYLRWNILFSKSLFKILCYTGTPYQKL